MSDTQAIFMFRDGNKPEMDLGEVRGACSIDGAKFAMIFLPDNILVGLDVAACRFVAEALMHAAEILEGEGESVGENGEACGEGD